TTRKNFSRKIRFTTYVAYGTKDKEFKGHAKVNYAISNEPERRLEFNFKQDNALLGASSDDILTEGSMMKSMLAKNNGSGDRRSLVRKFSASYLNEWSPNVLQAYSITSRKIFANVNLPMMTSEGEAVPAINDNQIHVGTRFCWKEDVARGVFSNQHLYTKYPVVILDLGGSFKTPGKWSYQYLRPELSVTWKKMTPPLGYSRMMFNTGTIIGQVPYPLLKLHEGNSSYIYERSAFSCMNHYEFASDTWASFFFEHNFGGFFLGKIPLLNKTKMREVFTFKATYGSLSEKNGTKPLFIMPEGMSSLGGVPYVETGVGIANILRFIRVDTFWRLTHRREDMRNFAVNVGFEVMF
ncbi:MAG: carboxypeptidase-like regulatory domain-containing protein, partial [Bacteroidales bacterium]|nr:carboxypeptidase-like regulatory domain-containing protein [Bacteroidales bacterium]